MSKHIRKFMIIMFAMLLSACFSISNEESPEQPQSDLKGHILVWHSWEGEEHEVFKNLVERFTELHPGVTIAEETYPLVDIEETFSYEVEAGLGPDLLIAPANLVDSLASRELIRDISNQDIDLDVYLTTAIDMLRNEDKMYGLPLSLNTLALYYNKELLERPHPTNSPEDELIKLIQDKQKVITQTEVLSVLNELGAAVSSVRAESEQVPPPTYLEDLLQQANKGQSIAIRTDFYGAFWGVQTFGGRLFDDEGRVVLNQGGFVNWLGWLKNSQGNSGIILNRNHDVLSDLFASGEVTYYVGSTQELHTFQATLGKDVVGAVRLPGRQNMPAGPFLQAEALMFSSVSAPQSLDVALQLAQYLTNVEQQRQLALSVGKLPANKRVKIDPRVSPIVAEFIAQSRTAVPVSLKNIKKFNDVIDHGNDLYGQILEGEINVGEAASLLTEKINEKYGLETSAFNPLEDCEVQGSIVLWNTWTDQRREALKEIQENFMRTCPNALITITDIDPIEFPQRYAQAIEAEQAPDIFMGTNQQLGQLVKEELILNLSDTIDSDFLQRFIPLVGQSIQYEGNVYGIPIGVNVMALYYNTSLVDDPPVVLNDLLIAATPERQVAIPIGFEESFWGITAFGESGDNSLFDEKNRLIIGELGLSEWLNWLKTAQNQPGIVMSTDITELQTMFIEEQAAFLIGDAWQLEALQTALGTEKIGVVPLPSGSPLLTVETLLISPFTTTEERAVALKFAQFMTDVESQEILLERADKIPVNINVNLADYPVIDGFVQQANGATVIPNRPETDAVFEWGDRVYEQVLENGIDPLNATRDFTNLVDATNGFEVAERTMEEECSEEEELSLWHSWTEAEQIAWQTVISDFVEICPNVVITTTFVQTDDFGQQLAATLETDSELPPPDFFIAAHAQLETYHTGELVQDISALVDEETLVDYLPKTVAAFSLGNALYGLPQALDLPVLYYHPDLVAEPTNTYHDLLVHARQGLTVAMNTGFYDVYGGGAAFGCRPCQTGQFIDETGELLLTKADLTDWRAWLQAAAQTDNFIFSTNQATLEKMFVEGQVAYLIAGSSFLREAQSKLGIAKVGLAPLPLGEEEQASRPFLRVDGFYFHQETAEEQTRLALKFAQFATRETNQTWLMQKANFVPINSLAIATANDLAIDTFISEIETSILLPNQSTLTLIEENDVYNIFDDLADDITQ